MKFEPGQQVRIIKFMDDPTITIEGASGYPVPVLGTTGVVEGYEEGHVSILLDPPVYETGLLFEEGELEPVLNGLLSQDGWPAVEIGGRLTEPFIDAEVYKILAGLFPDKALGGVYTEGGVYTTSEALDEGRLVVEGLSFEEASPKWEEFISKIEENYQ